MLATEVTPTCEQQTEVKAVVPGSYVSYPDCWPLQWVLNALGLAQQIPCITCIDDYSKTIYSTTRH